MGLDQYAYIVRREAVIDDTHFKPGDSIFPNSKLFFEWRKHYPIEDWMENLWMKRIGKPYEEFNCSYLHLKKRDIITLHHDIEKPDFVDRKHTHWIYHDDYEYTNAEFEHDKEFCAKAIEAIDKGYAVYYCPWW